MIPGAVVCAAPEIMDPTFGTHCHRIDSNSFIEYRPPNPNKVKYTPPSPTTSGYSESGSEMDNPDSGRVSELEGSPKMQPRRPETISLNMEMFSPNQSGITSPDPFPEGKSTIKLGHSTSNSAPLSDSPRLLTINEETLRTLVVCLHETKTKLNLMETKMDALVKIFQLHYRQSNEASSKLARAVLALGSDRRRERDSQRLENGRLFPERRESFAASDREVSIPCNSRDSTSPAPKSRKHQSSELLSSKQSPPFVNVLAEKSSFQASTYPRVDRSKSGSPPLSLVPSSGGVGCVHVDPCAFTETERVRPKYMDDNANVMALIGGNGFTNPEYEVKKSPVYAIVKKNKKTVDALVDDADQPPAPPVSPRYPSTSPDTRPSEADMNQMLEIVQEIKEGSETPRDDTFSNGESLTRVSRFSEVESLLSTLDTSTAFSDDKPFSDEGDEEFNGSRILEQNDNDATDVFDEEIFSPTPYRNLDSGSAADGLPKEKSEAPSATASWPSAQHEIVYSNAPNLQIALHVSPVESLRHSQLILSERLPNAEAAATVSCASINADTVSGKEVKSPDKTSRSEKSSSDSRNMGKIFVSNYGKFFKRKGKKKRSESQNSFTFVNSPLYEAQLRGQSVESVLSSERNPPSLSDKSPNHERSCFLSASQNSAPGINTNFGDASEQFAAEEIYDNLDAQGSEEMGHTSAKIAEKAFKDSPKILEGNETTLVIVHTAGMKPKLLNPSPPATPQLPLKEKLPPTEPSREDEIEEVIVFPPCVILEKLQREQADRIRFEVGNSTTPDNPPPKPNRPGFPHGGIQGSPRSSINAQSNGGVSVYPRGMPAVPPKQKIMTPEELTNHEAHEKLRMKLMEEAMLQQTLDQQQKQAAENARWLEQEEQMLNPEANGDEAALRRGRGSSSSLADMRGNIEAPPPPSVAPSKPPRKSSRPKDEPAGPPQTKLEEVKTAPTMQLNRDDDEVYKNTMEVVKAVLGMNNMTMNAKPDELFTCVKTVGAALKQLCASLDTVLPDLPEDFHREIDMAQRTTNKDLSQVINQLKLVQRFYTTTQVVDYKKCLMAANQVLAIDAKNLLDVVDRARIRKIQTAQEEAKAREDDIRMGASSQPAATGYEPEDLYPEGEFL